MTMFKLQTVLDHRQFVEDGLKKALAEIRQQALAARQTLDSLERKEMETGVKLAKAQEHGLPSDQVVAYHAYLNSLADQIGRQETEIEEIGEHEARKQDELLEAMKKRQILEKLKEQASERFKLAALKKEMAFIDEIAVNQFVRKSIEKNGGGR
jgi:flagellar protein FliJ